MGPFGCPIPTVSVWQGHGKPQEMGQVDELQGNANYQKTGQKVVYWLNFNQPWRV